LKDQLQRFKNEEGRQEEGEKKQARMILGEGGRGAAMREGADLCRTGHADNVNP
jgi:hypothetical protein